MKRFRGWWFLLVSFLFVTLFSRATSFLYVFEGADPSIFKQMGLALLRGKVLYVDYFDNKGCLLYFIHALGLGLGGDFCILLMQALSLTVTLVIWDKLLALGKNLRQRNLCLGIALLLLACFYGAGDQTQEWCLPWISYPLLVFVRAYRNKSEITSGQWMLTGLCLGVITFIQVNNACAFLGFVLYYWIQCLSGKAFRPLFRSVGCFAAGWLMVAVPCVLYFYVKDGGHGVYEMVYATFLSNLEYIGVQHWVQWFHGVPYLLFLLAFLALNLVMLRRQKGLLVPFLIAWVLFVGTFGRLCNNFYLIAILPLCVVSMTVLDFVRKKRIKVALIALLMGCSVFMGSIAFFHVINDLVLQNEKEVAIYEDFHRCIANIPENERDSIYNYNLFWHGTGMMEHERLLQSNRVLYTYLAFQLPTLRKEETETIILPKWIMVSFEMPLFESDARFILENYELVCQFHYDRLYLRRPRIGNEFTVSFFRRPS